MKKHVTSCYLLSFLSLLLLILKEIWGEVYYVGPQKTYKEINEVVNLLKAGDTVLVDGNAEYKGDISFRKSGTSQSKIVIKGLKIDGKRPHIKGGTNTVAFISDWPYSSGADHYIFEGFEFPSPLILPQYEPPERQKTDSPKNRHQKTTIDIGAYSFESGTVTNKRGFSNKSIIFNILLKNKKLYYLSTQKISGELKIVIFTVNGRLLFHQSKKYAVPSYPSGVIELKNLPSGFLCLKIVNGKCVYIEKIFSF